MAKAKRVAKKTKLGAKVESPLAAVRREAALAWKDLETGVATPQMTVPKSQRPRRSPR